MLDKMLKSPSVWEKLKGADLPIVCYGTGNGADKIFDEFERRSDRICKFERKISRESKRTIGTEKAI